MTETEGSRWVEFIGGPYDGTMIEIGDASWMERGGGFVVFAKGERLPDGMFRRGGGQGHYVVAGLVDEELRIVRMQWRHDPPEELH